MINRLKTAFPSILITASIGATYANSANAAGLDGAKLFKDKTCHTCHGVDARSPLIATYPAIAGQAKEYLLQQMKDIKSGVRNNGQTAAMKGVMHLVSDEELEAIAAYLSTLDYQSARPAVSKAPVKASTTTTPVAEAPATTSKASAKAGKHDGSGEKVWMTHGGEREVALGLKGNPDDGLDIFEVCAGCHLTEGWGKPDGTFPQLAGQHADVLIKQLTDIRSKNRDNPTMYPFALPESIGNAQALADVVAYIEKLPMNPDNGKGEWAEGTPQFDKGKKLFKDNCVKCHGEQGEGNPEKFYPLLQGQHYNYMLRQFHWIRDGKRRNANPDMVKQIKGFSDDDMKMVINYVSRIKVPKEKLAPSKDWLNPDFD